MGTHDLGVEALYSPARLRLAPFSLIAWTSRGRVGVYGVSFDDGPAFPERYQVEVRPELPHVSCDCEVAGARMRQARYPHRACLRSISYERSEFGHPGLDYLAARDPRRFAFLNG
jgi:hypothetical protein